MPPRLAPCVTHPLAVRPHGLAAPGHGDSLAAVPGREDSLAAAPGPEDSREGDEGGEGGEGLRGDSEPAPEHL